MLLLESKWVNLELIDRVVENLEGETELDVYHDFDTVISTLRSE